MPAFRPVNQIPAAYRAPSALRRLPAAGVLLLLALALLTGCDSGGSSMEEGPPNNGQPTVESVSAEWTSVPEAEVGDTITAEGQAEATLSDGTTEPADSAHVLWRDSLIHRAENQTSIETEVIVQSGEEGELVLRAFASGKEGEATRSLMPEEVVTGAAAEWTSVPSVAGDTVVAQGRALAVFSDGSTQAADSAEVRWRGETVRRVEEKKTVEVRVPTETRGTGELVLRAFASGSEEEATETVEVDLTPPGLVASGEEGSEYGRARGTVESDEMLSRVEVYLVSDSRTDSTLVLSEENVQEATFGADALDFYQPGDRALFRAYAEDQVGNASRDTARAVVDGTDVDVTTLASDSRPDVGNQPTQAYVTTPDTTVQSGANGEIILENLTPGDTVKVNDERDPAQIGDFYEANIPVTTETDTVFAALMLENTGVAPGDEHYANSLDLVLDATDGYMRIPPNELVPDWNQTPDELYPLSFAINQNGKNLPDEHREKLKEGIRSWNGDQVPFLV